MKTLLICLLAIFTSTELVAQQKPKNKDIDSLTAVNIAESSWIKKYGEKIYDSKPFYATLREGVIWVVKGTHRYAHGGVPYAEIRKKDGVVLFTLHMK